MNIVRRWKRGMAVGCSHGNLADQSALKAALDFKKRWKPDTTLHLGDAFDMAALRSGAKGTADESKDIDEDWKAGQSFLERLQPDLIFYGNHEDRISRLTHSPNALVKLAALRCQQALQDVAKSVHAKIVPYDIETGWRQYGDTLFGHGYMFNEMAIRDHAELVGKCVIAHLHRVGQERARRLGGATGYCVGMLADKTKMDYAKHQKAKTKWSNGWSFFEYCDDETVIWLTERTKTGEWRTPL